VKEKVEELIPVLERFKENIAMTAHGGDQAENQRRSVLSRCVRRPPILPTLVNGVVSALEEIEKRSRVLLEKGTGARFVDKGEDSKEVAGLVERLREAVTYYQVSKTVWTHREVRLTQEGRYRNNKRSMIKLQTSL